MIQLGTTSLNSIPRIAVSITDEESNEQIISKHIDVLEVRIDQFKDYGVEYVRRNIEERTKINIPIILTIRNDESEGGRTDISDQHKYELFKAVVSSVDAIDIELKSPIVSKVVDLAKKNQKKVIISSHNFVETPNDAELEKILEGAKSEGADIVKMAMYANSAEDVKSFMAFTLKHKDEDIITMSLGSIGSISRLTFLAAGSLLTYSYIGKQSAPGQLPLHRLQDDLRVYYPAYNQHIIDHFELLEYA